MRTSLFLLAGFFSLESFSFAHILGEKQIVSDQQQPSALRRYPGPDQTLRSERTLQSARILSNVRKPSVGDDFRPYLPTFVPHKFTESCNKVVEEIDATTSVSGDFVLRSIFDSLEVYQNVLNDHLISLQLQGNSSDIADAAYDDTQEGVDWRKEVLSNTPKNLEAFLKMVSVNSLYISSEDSSGEPNFFERLVKCTADEVSGRTLIQKMVEYGFEKALKTDLVSELMRGVEDYDPTLVLDSNGNSLLHLAVLSRVSNTPQTIHQLILAINSEMPESKIKSLYWMVGALELQNKDGKKPYELVESGSSVQQFLKSIFRLYTYSLKMQLRLHTRALRLASAKNLASSATLKSKL